ncbi:MAG: type II toxin-antitoxin system HipA family toxin [Alphaproteobacteria bacterium]|nr:type II toxin-antitoxin system HipA family toxin [Alphaproteobacteria bacterium]
MRELRVGLSFFKGERLEVGTLVERGRQVWFQFDPTFADGGLEISPLRLPLSIRELHAHPPKPGVPIPGVFNDARPDGWGLKLLHRAFQRNGRIASSVSPLDELAFLGARTMGALVFEPCTGPDSELDDAIELAALAAHAQTVWDDAVEEVLPELVRAGGPSGGARPKALIALRTDGAPGFRYGDSALLEGWEAWLVKFPTSRDDAEVGRREGAWMKMAAKAGIRVPEHRVFHLDGVGDAFAVKRFDRLPSGGRAHMLSGAGALDVDFRTASADYEHLLRVTGFICQGDQSQVLDMFRLAVFNVAALNQDDHLKNFAWLMDEAGGWRLAPGFDLTYAPQPQGERATTVAGVGRDVGRAELLELASRVGIKARSARRVMEEVTAATAEVASVLHDAGCSGAVSRAAARDVLQATRRVGGT